MAFGKDRLPVSELTLPAGKTSFTFFDDELKRFCVRVRASGSNSYWIVYRLGGKQRWLLIGECDLFTTKQAREVARTKLAMVQLGIDPAAEKHAERTASAMTFKLVVQKYIEAEKARWSHASLYQKTLYLFDGDYFKPLHARPISSITRKDIAPLIRDIRTKHSDSTAAQARTQCSTFFKWAMAEGLADQNVNPVLDTAKPPEGKPRERVLRPHEIHALWRACETAGEFGTIVRLLLLSGCRRSEIGGLRWSEIHDDAIHLPAQRCKNGRAYTIPITPLMRSILDTVPRMAEREQLFGVWADKGFADWSASKARLPALDEPWTLHDTRRTFRTGLGALKVPTHISELCINHAKGKLVATYDKHTYAVEIADAFTRWSNHVAGIVSDGKIVPMRA
jgi:integrase